MNQRLAVLGAGNMGEAVLAGALSGGWAASDVVATVRTEAKAQHLRETYQVATTSDNAAAVRGAGLVLVGVKPKDVGALLEEVAPALDPSAVVVTVAAGLPTTFYEERLPAGLPVVRTVPNTPAAIGAGITAIAPGASATDAHLEAVEHLLAGTGAVVRAAEKDLDAVTAISGSGPAYVFHVADALAEAGVLLGLTRDVARRLATQTLLGASRLLDESGEHPVILREKVTSPGGTTAAGLRELDDRAVRAAFVAAAAAARDRARELAG
ncbi:pyrroline-5-carboxylate reductase [Promicromonospora citrea]|uniref:Pyrroline-5-carboxylate reductase n=1 Tax=Promicromonospora citrea TaxID=43677 RepID=A0A8H9GJT7_9MICO|nr:pyrroline-5-carboxylate reductase [Promicromonospora citrea]NNH51885.1 pyrroline-5-carboxylate reductase [Promicromonospora citrea]GGM33140.1 pyrroline-5-carboxylate reductase [Promicromonospora citrea]